MKKSIVYLFYFLTSGFAGAQGLYNNGALISISSQTILTIPDSLVNNGTIINDGVLNIAGPWNNQGTYSPSNGQINFTSDLTQTINHSNQTIGSLTLSGGGKKEFLADITVLNNLSFVDGILVSQNNAKIILNQSVIVTGGSAKSHILGPVEIHGGGDWLFPIGNGTDYLPVEIINITDTSARATITLNELIAGQPADSFGPELAKVSSKRVWGMKVSNGKFDQSKISLSLQGEDDLADKLNLLVVAGSNNASGPYVSLGQSQVLGTLTSGTMTSDKAPTYSFYTAASLLGDVSIEVYNALSPNGDGKNDYMAIKNIELYPNNKVYIVDRWGDRVFEMSGYDNAQKVFKGNMNVKGTAKLPSGTYYYFVNLNDGSDEKKGFLEIR